MMTTINATLYVMAAHLGVFRRQPECRGPSIRIQTNHTVVGTQRSVVLSRLTSTSRAMASLAVYIIYLVLCVP